jgi:hypothetical protein
MIRSLNVKTKNVQRSTQSYEQNSRKHNPRRVFKEEIWFDDVCNEEQNGKNTTKEFIGPKTDMFFFFSTKSITI